MINASTQSTSNSTPKSVLGCSDVGVSAFNIRDRDGNNDIVTKFVVKANIVNELKLTKGMTARVTQHPTDKRLFYVRFCPADYRKGNKLFNGQKNAHIEFVNYGIFSRVMPVSRCTITKKDFEKKALFLRLSDEIPLESIYKY